MVERQAPFERVEALIAEGDEHSLAYAALELRRVIEHLVYRKLAAYAEFVPSAVMQTWQPPQALKALLQFEPDADKDFEVRIAPGGTSTDDESAWLSLGDHKALKAKWLSKNYNKLGSYLHAPHGDQPPRDFAKVGVDLARISNELREVAESPVTAMSLDDRVTVDCMACKRPLMVNVDVLRDRGLASCFNDGCGAIHLAQLVDDEWVFRLDAVEAPCISCGETVEFAKSLLVAGTIVECIKCGTQHELRLSWELLDAPASQAG